MHRIDRDTSGVVLLVCSPKALRPFQALFRAHSIERSYVAVVEGAIEPPRGTIDRPLVADRGDGRRGTSRRTGEGTRAITHYETVERFGGLATQLLCRLETGRTHQIRDPSGRSWPSCHWRAGLSLVGTAPVSRCRFRGRRCTLRRLGLCIQLRVRRYVSRRRCLTISPG